MSFPQDIRLEHGEQHNIPTAAKLFPIGTRGYLGDKAFRYVKFGNVSGAQGSWVVDDGVTIESGHLVYSSQVDVTGQDFTAGGGAGEKTITVQDSTVAYWTLDAFENGTFNYNGTTTWSCRIESSTATGTVGGNANCSVVTIETTFPISFLTEETTVRFIKSKYMDVTRPSGAHSHIDQAAIGVAVCFNFTGRIVTTASYYGWIQTWGETCIQIATSHKGGTTGERQLHARGAGGAQMVDSNDNNQVIGHYLQKTQANITKPLIYLQIAP